MKEDKKERADERKNSPLPRFYNLNSETNTSSNFIFYTLTYVESEITLKSKLLNIYVYSNFHTA